MELQIRLTAVRDVKGDDLPSVYIAARVISSNFMEGAFNRQSIPGDLPNGGELGEEGEEAGVEV